MYAKHYWTLGELLLEASLPAPSEGYLELHLHYNIEMKIKKYNPNIPASVAIKKHFYL
jgi:hypothetical protein